MPHIKRYSTDRTTLILAASWSSNICRSLAHKNQGEDACLETVSENVRNNYRQAEDFRQGLPSIGLLYSQIVYEKGEQETEHNRRLD